MRDDRERLTDMLEAIERIERYASRGEAALRSEELLQVWVLHHLQVLGEVARRISDATRQKWPGIPWIKIVGMRHVLVHEYFGIDVESVLEVVRRDLPSLKEILQRALDSMPDAGG